MDLKIEIMTLDDLNSIQPVLFTEFDDFWSYSTFMQELKCDNSYFVVAKNDCDEIIGFAGLKVVFDEADIMNIVVKKSFRHNGLGSILLEHLINYAKSSNIKTLHLEVNEHNLSAICLYDKFNFERIAIRKKYYNGENDAIIMSKKI